MTQANDFNSKPNVIFTMKHTPEEAIGCIGLKIFSRRASIGSNMIKNIRNGMWIILRAGMM